MPMPVILVIRLLLEAMFTLSQWVNGFDPQVFPKIQLASLQMVSNVQRWQQLDYGVVPVPQKRSRRELAQAWVRSLNEEDTP